MGCFLEMLGKLCVKETVHEAKRLMGRCPTCKTTVQEEEEELDSINADCLASYSSNHVNKKT